MNAARRIAAHWLWTPQGLVRRPVVTLTAAGRPASVASCAEPDRLAATEFYAGLLIFDFPAAWAADFGSLRRCGRPLLELLREAVPAPDGCTVVLSGLDYASFALTPQAQLRRL